MTTLEVARETLRVRQGTGARYDAPEAPVDALRWARLGTAFFARRLADLTNEQLDEPASIPGWSRSHVAAGVAYHARALCRQLEAVSAGQPVSAMYESSESRAHEVAFGGTLPARALRHLVEHAAIHLDVVWRDLPGARWNLLAEDEEGHSRPIRDTPFERAAVVWLGAADLAGLRMPLPLPPDLREALGDTDPRHGLATLRIAGDRKRKSR